MRENINLELGIKKIRKCFILFLMITYYSIKEIMFLLIFVMDLVGFPLNWDSGSGKTFIDFFQIDRFTGKKKGIIKLKLWKEGKGYQWRIRKVVCGKALIQMGMSGK